MAVHLLPCPGCARHVRASEIECPFCRAPMSAIAAPRAPQIRLGRAATFAFGAAVATSIAAGCSDETAGGDAGLRIDAQTAADAGVSDDAMIGDDGGPAPLYGAPPPDASTAEDAGGPAPAYGAPPEQDAGIDSGGGPAPLYGAPPEP